MSSTRRGFLSSLLLAPFAAKVLQTPVDPPIAGTDSPAPDKLRDVSIHKTLGGPESASFKAPIHSFKLGQRVSLSFGGAHQFDGVVDTVMRVPQDNVEHVTCRDWASWSRDMSSTFTKRLMREMGTRRINL
jgi:hypothetical protein